MPASILASHPFRTLTRRFYLPSYIASRGMPKAMAEQHQKALARVQSVLQQHPSHPAVTDVDAEFEFNEHIPSSSFMRLGSSVNSSATAVINIRASDLNKMTDAQVAFVVNHERAHLAKADPEKLFLFNSLKLVVGLGCFFTASETGDTMSCAAAGAALITVIKLGQRCLMRRSEYRADALAVNNSPHLCQAAIEYLTRESQTSQKSSLIQRFMSTHPPLEKRVAALEQIKNKPRA